MKRLACATLALAALAPAAARALEPLPAGVDVVEKLNEPVPLDLALTDENGRSVRLGDYLRDGKPVLLTLVYFRCPMLCSLVLNGMVGALRQQEWQLGREFRAIAVSFDPAETPPLAREKQHGYAQALGRPEAASAWPFLTGSPQAIARLADAVGFRYRWDAETKQFDHTAVLIALSPEGKVTRYLYGVQFAPRDVKLALFEAARGKVGTTFDRVLLRCYRYDPSTRSYRLFALTFTRVGASLVLVALAAFLVVLWRRDLRRSRS